MDALLKINDLKVYFFVRKSLFRTVPVKAVDGVGLDVNRGETVALVGESGSGKTTLARAILHLIDITRGSVVFNEEDVSRFNKSQLKRFRRQVQAVFQDPYSSISPFMNVSDIIEEPLRIHGIRSKSERRERIDRAVELVKLTPADEIVSKFPHSLSGGQRQRVSIARALVLSPEFIVADEPVSMVDASNRAEILHLLRELQTEHDISFLYITHDLASARHFSDRTAVMYLGTLVELGPTVNVIDNPFHPYTQGLLQSVPEPDPENRRKLRKVIPGEPPSAMNVPEGCPFHPRCPSFMKNVCEIARPVLKNVESNHLTACHLYK